MYLKIQFTFHKKESIISYSLCPGRCRQYAPRTPRNVSNCLTFSHGITSQKTRIFSNSTLRTYNLANRVAGTCIVLYCTVLYCTVLHCTVLYCTVLYCTVLHCTVLHCTALHCTVLHCTVLYMVRITNAFFVRIIQSV